MNFKGKKEVVKPNNREIRNEDLQKNVTLLHAIDK